MGNYWNALKHWDYANHTTASHIEVFEIVVTCKGLCIRKQQRKLIWKAAIEDLY